MTTMVVAAEDEARFEYLAIKYAVEAAECFDGALPANCCLSAGNGSLQVSVDLPDGATHGNSFDLNFKEGGGHIRKGEANEWVRKIKEGLAELDKGNPETPYKGMLSKMADDGNLRVVLISGFYYWASGEKLVGEKENKRLPGEEIATRLLNPMPDAESLKKAAEEAEAAIKAGKTDVKKEKHSDIIKALNDHYQLEANKLRMRETFRYLLDDDDNLTRLRKAECFFCRDWKSTARTGSNLGVPGHNL